MASNFLRKKAEEQARGITERSGKDAYGGTGWRNSQTEAGERVGGAEPSPAQGNQYESTRASGFLSKKAEQQAASISERFGEDAYGGTRWRSENSALSNDALSGLLNRIQGLETPGSSTDIPKTSGGFYSRQTPGDEWKDIYSKVSYLPGAMREYGLPLESAASDLQRAESNLKIIDSYMNRAKEAYDAAPSEQNASVYNQIASAYVRAYQVYTDRYETYHDTCTKYMAVEEQVGQIMSAYQQYTGAQQAAFDEWRNTIRDAGTVQEEIARIEEELADVQEKKTGLERLLRNYGDHTGGNYTNQLAGYENQITQLENALELVQEELSWSQYYQYADLVQAADFAEKSRYVTTANGREPVLNSWGGIYTETGFDDLTYDYINRNEEAMGKAMVNSIGSNTALLGLDKSYLKEMTDEEISIFNYLYATQGADAAYQYTAYLTGDLTKRQRMEQEAQWAAWAEKDPVGSSVFSVMMSPMKGLSYLSQAADYLTTGKIDQNAAYNKFSYIPGSIRGQVVKEIEESGKWGKVGSFAYQTGLSMADFLLNTAIAGGNEAVSLAIMGTGAAADATIEAKERGLTDTQAFLLGTIAGAAEIITEKVSLETLLNPDLLKNGAGKYVLKNMLAEGSEEAGSDLINLIADILIAKDQSEWKASIDHYTAQGKTDSEAFGLAIADQAVTMGLDFLGGAISGGIMSGVNAGIHVNYTNQMGSELNGMDLGKEDIQAFIESGLESDPETASYQLAAEMQKKIEAGKELTGYDLARLWQANAQAIQEENSAEDLRNDVITDDDQTEAVAGDATDPSGLSLQSVENGTQTQANDTDLPASAPLSIAEQLRQEQTQNGGTQYENSYERTAGSATAQPAGELYASGRTGLSDGGSQRYDGAGAGEQAGSLAGRTGQTAQRNWTGADRARATIRRSNLGKNLRIEKVSSIDLGLQTGTDTKRVQIIPQEYWDDSMAAKAEQVYQETGKQVSYILGSIEFRNARGTVSTAKGATTKDRIIVQANHSAYTAEQIADHEAYHGMRDFYGQRLSNQLVERIQEEFSKEEFQQVLGNYVRALRCVYDLTSARDGAEYEERMNRIVEELLADAYAGMNMWGAGATKFTDTVNRYLDDNNISRKPEQDNGTRETTGPPFERFSHEDQSSIKQQLVAASNALNGMDPVANITISANLLAMDKAQKQEWVINKLRPTGYSVNRRGLGLIEFAQKRLKSAFNYFRRNSAEEAVFEALPNVLRDGIEIGGHMDHKGRSYGTVTIAAPIIVNGARGNMAVVVKRTTGNYYKVHRVLSPDGAEFILETKEEAAPTSGGGVTNNGSLAAPISSASGDIITDRNSGVKERFSYAGENADSADLDALARAKEMQAAGVADETIRQQTGWHTGMDGKWRWEIDDSTAQYRPDGDARLLEEPGYQRLQELTEKWAENDGLLSTGEQLEMDRLQEEYTDRVWMEKYMTGGRTFADKELYSQGKRTEAFAQGTTVRMAPETVKAIVSDLTPQELELARLLEQYYNSLATQEINKVSNILYGYDKAMGKNYAPIYTNRNYTKTEFGVFDTTAEGVDNLKGRQCAENPSYNIGAFDAFEKHMDHTSRFVGMAIPTRNWKTLMNWQEKNNSTGDVITHKWGEEGKSYITDLITTLQEGGGSKSDVVQSGVEKLRNNYISAVFGANPSIVLKQLGSIPLAAAYLDAKNFPSVRQISGIDRSLISKYTQDLEWRTMGYSMPETKILKDNPNWTQSNKVANFLVGGGAITAMDGWAASVLWPWAENKVSREFPELSRGTDAQIRNGQSPFYQKVAEEFENAVARSQSTSDEIHQSTLRKSKNPFTQVFTMFRSDSAQTYNVLRQKIGEAQYYARTGADMKTIRAARKAVGVAATSALVGYVWAEAVELLMNLWKHKGKNYRDDDDELTAESIAKEMVSGLVGDIAGVVIGGEELYDFLGSLLTDGTPFGIETMGLEQLNDCAEAMWYAGCGLRDAISDGADILKNGGNPGEYFRRHGNEMLGGIKDIANTAAMYIFGFPAENLEKYLLGGIKWLAPELQARYEDLLNTPGKTDLSGLNGDALAARVGDIIDNRGITASEETAWALAQLYEAGEKTAFFSDTPDSISIDGEKRILSAYQQQTYDKVWTSIVSDGLDELVGTSTFAEAENGARAKMLSNLYAYAAERARAELFDDYEMDSGAAKNAAIVAAGVTVAECITWNTITSEMKSGEKSAELASWNIPESAKREIFRCKISESREDSIAAFDEAGLSFDQFLQAYSMYGQINNEDLKAGMKAVEFSHWVNAQDYTAKQAAVVKDELAYYGMTPVSSSRYDELVESGVDPNDAYNLTGALNELQPDDGADEVTDLQKWRASVDFSDDVEDQLAALSVVMTDAQFQKTEIANSFGINPDTYVAFLEIKPQYDADSNGSYTQKEIQTAVDGLPGYYTKEQKAVLWQLATGATSAKNNPYSRDVGQQVLDARAAAKEAAAQEQAEAPTDSTDDSFSQALLDQLLGRG